MKKKVATKAPTRRYEDLKRILEDRRREILSEVQGKIRDVRTEGSSSKLNEVFDAGESSEADIQEDIEFALIQMKAETLNKINEALSGSRKAPTATASSAARRSRKRGCARCRSRCAARIAKRRVRLRPSASASGSSAGAGPRFSWICPARLGSLPTLSGVRSLPPRRWQTGLTPFHLFVRSVPEGSP